MKKWKMMLTTVLFALLLTSCTAEADTETAPPETESDLTAETAETAVKTAQITPLTDVYSVTETEIDLDGITAQAVRISAAGTYTVRGTYEGMLIVDAGKADEVTLLLDGADITSPTSAAVYVKRAAKVSVTLADGSTNILANGGEYVNIDANNIDAVIFSKSDLTMGGTGSLTVAADAGHGIVSKDSLDLTGGTYDITAAGHGITAKDSLTLTDGAFAITSGKDGLHAENADDLTLGNIHITGGTVTITSAGDGIAASGTLQIDELNADITSGGGPENAAAHADDMMGWGGGRGFFGWDRDDSYSSDTEETTDETTVASFKSLKSDGDMILNGGTFMLSSAEDTIHTNANLTVNGGTYTLAAGDDGLHADLALVISGGELTVMESYEGVEAKTIDVNGGVLTVKASDDGFNASGGTSTGWNMMAAEEGVYFKVNGGTIYLDADGDGLDSNGDFIVTGGEVYVSGPTNSGNGALDYGGEAIAEGGTVIAAGASGMAESFGSSSTQGAIMLNTGNQQAGSAVTLTDEAGNVLAEYAFEKSFSNVVVTSPEIVVGGTYTLTAGTYSETVTMEALLYGSGSGFGGMFGGMGGGRGNGGGGRNNRVEQEQTEGTENEEPADKPADVPDDVPAMPDGEAPVMPEGEVPQMPEGEIPELPEGFDPGAMRDMGGERPEMPEGGMQMPEGEMPEMPQGGGFGGMGGGRPDNMGEPPQMP